MAEKTSAPNVQSIVTELTSPPYDLLASSTSLQGKRVFLRVDFNVPVNSQGQITDASRIDSALPTVRRLCEKGAKVILASHFGRPEPKKQTLQDMQAQYSLQPVSAYLSQQLGDPYTGLVHDCIGPGAEAAAASLRPGQVSASS